MYTFSHLMLILKRHVEDFVRQFLGRSLPVELAESFFPTQLRETQNILLQQQKQDMKVQMVVCMLQRHLLVQLHTYGLFVHPMPRCKKKVSEEWNVLDGTLQRSPSFSDNASVTSEESFTLSTPGMLVAQLSKTNVHAGICVCSSLY